MFNCLWCFYFVLEFYLCYCNAYLFLSLARWSVVGAGLASYVLSVHYKTNMYQSRGKSDRSGVYLEW